MNLPFDISGLTQAFAGTDANGRAPRPDQDAPGKRFPNLLGNCQEKRGIDDTAVGLHHAENQIIEKDLSIFAGNRISVADIDGLSPASAGQMILDSDIIVSPENRSAFDIYSSFAGETVNSAGTDPGREEESSSGPEMLPQSMKTDGKPLTDKEILAILKYLNVHSENSPAGKYTDNLLHSFSSRRDGTAIPEILIEAARLPGDSIEKSGAIPSWLADELRLDNVGISAGPAREADGRIVIADYEGQLRQLLKMTDPEKEPERQVLDIDKNNDSKPAVKSEKSHGDRTPSGEKDGFIRLPGERVGAGPIKDFAEGKSSGGINERGNLVEPLSSTMDSSGPNPGPSRLDAQPVRFIIPEPADHNGTAMHRTIIIKMEPEHLGAVRLTLSSAHDNITGRLVVESFAAKTAVEHNLNQLLEHLDRQGIKIDSFEISIGGGEIGKGAGSRKDPGFARHVSFSPERHGSVEEIVDTPVPLRPVNSYVGMSGVNCYA